MDQLAERRERDQLSEAAIRARRKAGIPAHLVLLGERELAKLAGVSRGCVNKAIRDGRPFTPRRDWPEPVRPNPAAPKVKPHTLLARLRLILRYRSQRPLHAIFFARMRT